MSSRILFIILATLLFLSSFTAATIENLDEREPSSNYTVTPSFDTEIGPVNKNVDALAAYSFDSNMQHNNTSISFGVSQTRLENSTRIISSFGERKIGSKNAAEASLFILTLTVT